MTRRRIYNPELVEKLEAERAQGMPERFPPKGRPDDIAELVRAVYETHREGKPRRRKSG